MGSQDAVHVAGRLDPADPELLAEVLESVLGACDQGVWVLDAEGRTVVANSRMAQLLGVDARLLAAGTRAEVALPPITPVLRDKLAQRAAGVSERYVLQVVLPDGGARSVAVSGSPRYDRAGRHVGAIATCADVTGRQPEPDAQLTAAEAVRAMFWAATLKLSARESQVLHRLLVGDGVPAIARSLSVTQSVIRNQVASAVGKAGVGSQQELVSLLRGHSQADTQDEGE